MFKRHATQCILITLLLLPALVLTGGCNDCDDTLVVEDNGPPSVPAGLYSVTGDGICTLYWNPNPEPDIAGYGVYWHDQPTGYYTRITNVPASQTSYIVDFHALGFSNGTTLYFAVDAYDKDGLRSEDLSYETVFDTPRPEGFDLVLYDYLGPNSNLSGYDFSSVSGKAQPDSELTTDVYFGTSNGVYLLYATTGVDIQDYGYIDLIDVDWAPSGGWAPSHQAEMIIGHSYLLRISDKAGGHNFAKIYVVDVAPSSVTLDWAYQEVTDLPELSPVRGGVSE
jgi:hypothetical protein